MTRDKTTKKEKTRYDINLLTSFCAENKIELLKDYSKENINCKKRIEGKCLNNKCENKFNKKFCKLLKSGAYCIVCTKINSITKIKKKCTAGIRHTTCLCLSIYRGTATSCSNHYCSTKNPAICNG